MNRLLAAALMPAADARTRESFARRRQRIARLCPLRSEINEMSPLSSHSRPHITISRIQEVVAEYFGVATSDLLSVRKTRDVTEPRQIAIYLCCCETNQDAAKIGDRFCRDRKSVEEAFSKIALALMQGNQRTAADIAAVRAKLGLTEG